MTTVHLTENLKCFIRDVVSTGRYASEADVIADALTRLERTIAASARSSNQSAGSGEPGKKLTKQEFHRHLVKIGLLDHPPQVGAGAENSRELIDGEGEIVDEVVIRERLIEWLTGFLGR